MKPLEISVREVAADCREITIRGELDLATSSALFDPLREACEAADHVLVSLRECEFIDSTGISAIVQARKELAEVGCKLILFDASQQVNRVLEITGLTSDRIFADSRDAALAACGIQLKASGDAALSG